MSEPHTKTPPVGGAFKSLVYSLSLIKLPE